MYNQETSLYDILDIKPDASPQEVREGYLRTKSAYGKDSIALYTLIDTEERERVLGEIEQAYDVLSNADRRKDYDRNHGLLEFDEDAARPSRAPFNKKIISIDRVPPMESSSSESMLVAPTTDFTTRTAPTPPMTPPMEVLAEAEDPGLDAFNTSAPVPTPEAPVVPILAAGAAGAQASPQASPQASKEAPRHNESALAQEIAQEVEWRGPFLRRIREARRISIEEMSNITKVTKSYLLAIEEENFPKLPAPVFMRGFVTQLAKVLKLPHDQVASAYMARYYQARSNDTTAQ